MPDPIDGERGARNSRGTIVVEEGTVLATTAFAGAQTVMRLHAPAIAGRSLPGHFIHLRCAPAQLMRRPMSIMRAENGWIEILFKVHGSGTAELAARKVGDSISMIGPIGRPFKQSGYRPRSLLIGGGVGIPPMIFLADRMRAHRTQSFVIMGSEIPFPFTVKPSQILTAGVPPHVIGTMPLLEDWGIACRLASRQGYAGCFDGLVTELAEHWLEQQKAAGEEAIEIFACGPTPMLKAVAAVAARHALPCQISLEEFMACAVGGCAGCAVAVHGESGLAMKRVCVDGPVFESKDIVFS